MENLPPLREKLATICGNYLTAQQDILETFVDRGQLRKLAAPTVLPNGKQITGLKLDHPRQLALMHALVRFAHIAAGSTFTTLELYPSVLAALQTSSEHCFSTWQFKLAKIVFLLRKNGTWVRHDLGERGGGEANGAGLRPSSTDSVGQSSGFPTNSALNVSNFAIAPGLGRLPIT